jgi:hypothetical protein
VKEKRRRFLRIALLTLLFIALLLIIVIFKNSSDGDNIIDGIYDTTMHSGFKIEYESASMDSTQTNLDSIQNAQVKKKVKTYNKGTEDASDTNTYVSIITPDNTPPSISANPGPGIYPTHMTAKLISNEEGIIQYRIEDSKEWLSYDKPFTITDSLDIYARAFDVAGNVSETIHRAWKIQREPFACPVGMVPIDGKANRFCIDLYEWPNKKGSTPDSYINWYAAGDSCRRIGKRLCSSSEWELACGGIGGLNYPYGNKYETRTCVTEETKVYDSGIKEECRSPFGVYDLSGNLREWTVTKSEKNSNHYKVYGGFWANSSSSKCNTTQYSFFPENKFIHIGFRCCKDQP